MTDLSRAMKISASGMQAQGTRLRVVSENIANANSTAPNPGASPYRRQTVYFDQILDRQLGVDVVHVRKIGTDPRPFQLRYEPAHPASNADGYVLYPNVNTMVEMSDMREAQRSYEANLNTLNTSREMLQRTLDVIR